jgi:PAS domain S-box-containing protein
MTASILLVDDRPENLLALEAVLEPIGRPLERALSGDEALKKLLTEDVAVILLDVQMPGMDGFETADYIKRLERTKHIPIIFLTALSTDTEHVFRGYASGAVDYLTKPFDPAVLRSKVSVFIDLHEKDAALRQSEERFRAAFEDAPLGIGIVDSAGRLSAVNRSLARLNGQLAATLVGWPIGQLLDLGEQHDLSDLLQGSAAPIEACMRRADGSLRFVLASASPLHVGSDTQALVMIEDVTARREAEARATAMAAERSAQYEVAELHARLEANLLPSLEFTDPRLSVATRYRAGEDRLLLGGDFLDAIEVPDGRVALLIGDVSGHGPEAAAIGATLRSAWRGLVLGGTPDDRVLPTLDEVLVRERSSPESFVTVCAAWVEADRRTLTCSLAGHPAPLLLADGVASLVVPIGAPLGMLSEPSWDAGAIALPEEWSLLLYTDGLVEGLDGPSSARRFGTGRLANELSSLAPVPARVTDRALDVLLDRVKQANGGDLADDVGMLFVRCVKLSTSDPEDNHQDLSMALRLPVERASVRAARHAIEELCGRLHVPLQVRANLRLAVTEACANVVLHAYPTPQASEFEVEARAVPGESVEVIVRDYGGGMGRESASPGAGLGLSLIGTLSSHHEIRPAGQTGGTEVVMTFVLAAEHDGARRRRAASAR